MLSSLLHKCYVATVIKTSLSTVKLVIDRECPEMKNNSDKCVFRQICELTINNIYNFTHNLDNLYNVGVICGITHVISDNGYILRFYLYNGRNSNIRNVPIMELYVNSVLIILESKDVKRMCKIK